MVAIPYAEICGESGRYFTGGKGLAMFFLVGGEQVVPVVGRSGFFFGGLGFS